MKRREAQVVSGLQDSKKKGQKMKKTILLILLLIAGAVVGSLVGTAAAGVEALDWLSYSKEIGIEPGPINLVIIKLTFGIEFSMSIAQVIFMVVAVAVYPKLKKIIEG